MTWLDLAPDDPFGVHNLPFGAFDGRLGVRVGDHVVDLAAASARGLVDGPFAGPTLNPFLAAGRPLWAATRARLTDLLTDQAKAHAMGTAGRAWVESEWRWEAQAARLTSLLTTP